ncbi:uncharacterized [Lates japonicus]
MLCQFMKCEVVRHKSRSNPFCLASHFESPTLLSVGRVLVTSSAASRAVCVSPAIFPAGFQETNTLLEKRSLTPDYLCPDVVSRLFSSKSGYGSRRGLLRC